MKVKEDSEKVGLKLSIQKTKIIASAKTRPEADCGSDHELLIAKFRLKLKKVGKTTRPFIKAKSKNQAPNSYGPGWGGAACILFLLPPPVG